MKCPNCGAEMVIRTARTGFDCFAAILMLNNLKHASGDLLHNDSGIDHEIIQEISEGGYFSEKQIKKFIEKDWRKMHDFLGERDLGFLKYENSQIIIGRKDG